MSSSYWCYRCNRFVRLWRLDMLPMCPECDSGFVEEIVPPNRSEGRRLIGHHNSDNNSHRRSRRNNGDDPSSFNPIIMLRRRGESSEGTSREGGENRSGFELFYDEGVGNGLRPLPPRMSELLLRSGFERVMEHLSHVEANRSGHGRQNSPASKFVVESLPSIQINESHVVTESHCAVCMEPFEVGIAAREMPCKHIFHPECILPWLAIRNSCPVCRHELSSEPQHAGATTTSLDENDEENVGLTIWRLPGGGFAVGRFSGGDGGGGGEDESDQRELPIVYTEVDGGFNIVGEPRRISWSLSSSTHRRMGNGGGIRRMLNNFSQCLRGGVMHHQRSISHSHSPSSRDDNHVDNNPSPRARRTWSMDVNSGIRPW